MIDIEQTIISQYGNSSTIGTLITNMNESIQPDADIDNFFNVVFNVMTAEGFGLDIWGRIVGLPTGRYIYTSPVTVLNDAQFLKLILIKALSNISITTSRSFNTILQNYFAGRGRCYCSDQGAMHMRYTFEFLLQPFEVQIFAQPDIVLRPSGVGLGILQITLPVFGFKEGGTVSYTPFNQAPFVPAENIV